LTQLWLDVYSDANFVKVRFCLQHCHARCVMRETRPIKLCHMLYVSNTHPPVHSRIQPDVACLHFRSFSVRFVAKRHILQQVSEEANC